ncbi:TPA: glutamate racemase [Candidatus Gracilibacteria bacterium]|nr:glutamate racemase [Candidatus Gracilibacteria bacterium]
MIGFFDSGIGGLTVLREFRKILPEYDYCYFGDNARCPYGDRDDATIRQYTEEGVEFLFDQGAEIVILACNTATAHAIRYLQQVRFPDKKILGVTIPGAEHIIEGGYRKVGVLATESTVRNRAYKERVHIIDDTVQIQEIAAPELVPLIENGVFEGVLMEQILSTHLGKFDADIEALVLGCTHYPIIRHHIESILPHIPIIDPGYESAIKFREYLIRHPEIEKNLSRGGELSFFTSGDTMSFIKIGRNILNRDITQFTFSRS